MLAPGQVDDVARALLLLARELWVARDRMAVLEAVLDARGLDISAAVRDFEPPPALAERLAVERSAFTQAILDALCPTAEG